VNGIAVLVLEKEFKHLDVLAVVAIARVRDYIEVRGPFSESQIGIERRGEGA